MMTGRKRNGYQKKNRQRVWRRIRQDAVSILAVVILVFCIMGGYEYLATGGTQYTYHQLTGFLDAAYRLPETLTDAGGWLKEAGQKCGRLYDRLTGAQENRLEWMDADKIPQYEGESYREYQLSEEAFSEDEKQAAPYLNFSELDSLGRCKAAEAKISPQMLPKEERGPIGMIRPSGWHTIKYDCIDGRYLYNRCHLIAYQLCGENANEKNLITGTRWFNVNGMLPWENRTADYIRETGDSVLYRVTPVYAGEELVARGVWMEAESLKDGGLQFCVFVFNIQPGIGIDYKTGDSWVEQAD